MSFGQSSGPPASAKQLAYLASLLRKEGFEDFRSARHPYGLTQRQAGGKFTSKEASALIDRLTGVEPTEPEPGRGSGGDPDVDDRSPASEHDRTLGSLVAGVPASVLAAELERRGWTVTPP
jgi:hypothetical protein